MTRRRTRCHKPPLVRMLACLFGRRPRPAVLRTVTTYSVVGHCPIPILIHHTRRLPR